MSTALTEEQKVVHLLNRTSFGPTREAVQKVNRLGIPTYLDEQLHPERISGHPHGRKTRWSQNHAAE